MDGIADRDVIPPENNVDIRFEDFEVNPLDEARRIYDELDLPGYADAEIEFREHLSSHQGYKKNRYELDGNTIHKVQKHWGFAIDRWGYAPPVEGRKGSKCRQ